MKAGDRDDDRVLRCGTLELPLALLVRLAFWFRGRIPQYFKCCVFELFLPPPLCLLVLLDLGGVTKPDLVPAWRHPERAAPAAG
jgi:hypothetical protein